MKTSLKVLKVTAIMLIATVTLITACKKDSSSSSSSTDNNSAANMSANGATSDNAYDDVFNLAVQTGYDKNLDNLIHKGSGATTLGYNFCANVTVTGSAFPITLKVDFGSGCTSNDGIVRSGSITYVFSGKLSTPGTTISATFDSYKVNGYGLAGTYSITNSSPVNLSSFSLTTQVTDGSVTYPNDTSYSFSGTKTATLIAGNILDVSTLVFNITGNYSISSSYGESLTATVTTPLERKQSCAHIDKGVIGFKYTKGNASVNGTFDYGDGTCDNTALITIGAFTKTVTLP